MVLALAAFALTPTAPARACGGFFCSTVPVDQSGEKILFAVDANGIEVHVQISYQGDDTDFAWIVPTRQPPTLAVGVDALFTQLGLMTTPSYQPRWHYPDCGNDNTPTFTGGGSFLADAGAPSDLGSIGTPGVQVISQETVGPYDSVVLTSDDPKALATWLRTNNYRLTPDNEVLIEPYVLEHDYFVALKLHSGSTVRDLQPIVLRFTGDEPCVPLRLTAVAALNDMEVTAYLLGIARAVPTNFYEVKLNEAAIDWLGYGRNYQALVGAAAREAGGNAFVTEYAGPSSVMAGALYTPGRYDLAMLRRTTDPVDFLALLIQQGFQSTSQLRNLLRKWIPEPPSLVAQGVSEPQFYNNLAQYRDALAGFVFDPGGFTDDLDRLIVQPMMEAQSLFTRLPYLTRLYTLISPAEMTTDPTFSYNSAIGDVSNLHYADVYPSCSYTGPVRVELADGRIEWLPSDGDNSGMLGAMPAAESWYSHDRNGHTALVGTNLPDIDHFLAGNNGPYNNSSGCNVAAGSPSAALALLLLVGGAAWIGARARARRR
jgi:hypothetical protein